MLMPLEFYRHRYQSEVFTKDDVDEAIGKCCDEYLGIFDMIGLSDVLEELNGEKGSANGRQDANKRVFWTVAEVVDQSRGTNFQDQIVNEISRHLSAHYDHGQAGWPSPWKNLPLYAAWRQCMVLDTLAEKLGIRGLRELAKQLPDCPTEAVCELVRALGVNDANAEEFLACQLYSVSGWASYVKYCVRISESEGTTMFN